MVVLKTGLEDGLQAGNISRLVLPLTENLCITYIKDPYLLQFGPSLYNNKQYITSWGMECTAARIE